MLRASAVNMDLQDNESEAYIVIDSTSDTDPHRPTTSTSVLDSNLAICDPQEHPTPSLPTVFSSYTDHSNAPRISTENVIASKLRELYPSLDLTINPSMGCDLLAFARSGAATATVLGPEDQQLYTKSFMPPARRHENTGGAIIERIKLMAFMYKFGDAQFLLYVVEGRDGVMSYPMVTNNYILSSKGNTKSVHMLLEGATRWALALHNEVLVFDQGM